MIDILVIAIVWLLIGCGIAWIIGGATNRDETGNNDPALPDRRLHRRH